MSAITKESALNYHHLDGKPGKISVVPTKPLKTQLDLGLAYTPGVAYPVLEIEKDPNLAYEYTSKGNLVAVVSNGTAILGLGDRGALASKPVMEGKGVLFKAFADIDVFDIEVDSHDPDTVIEVTRAIAPTFGGINLEDIKSPECFYIETKLKDLLDIPVFHDDQHGTAIILGAAVLNALEITLRKPTDVKVVFSGAGASGISCANQLVKMGVPRNNIWMVDSHGLIYKGRKEKMTPEKEPYAQDFHPADLGEVIEGSDIFIGLSAANIVTPEMIKRMGSKPIIFAMANPDPEINYELAKQTRPDAILGTGRSDCPNQINNVLGFPFIFRGALDVRSRTINEEMKLAASFALAELTKEPVPDDVLKAYQLDHLEFGPDYVVPKPFDKRVCLWEAPAVAKAAMESGVARISVDLEQYRKQLERRLINR
jgi:malate dehydrogenase (oxaloacetate-decarboxylating)(NADP+)